MKPAAGAPIRQRVQQLAWHLKNYVRPLGLSKLGLPCQLMGSGMAFPWKAISSVDLASGNLVEDVKLGLDLAERGSAPIFCPSAYIESTFPASERGSVAQRRRWEVGSLRTLLVDAPRYLLSALRTRNWSLLVLTLDVMVPPVVLLGGVLAIFSLLDGVEAVAGMGYAPLALDTVSDVLFAGCLLLAWVIFGRHILRATEARQVVGHLLQKFRIYGRHLGQSAKWTRTDRS